jgi:hypothetical protein
LLFKRLGREDIAAIEKATARYGKFLELPAELTR